MSIEWTEISKLSGVKFGSRQTENPASQTANYERQTANSASQTETISASSISKNKESESQLRGRDFSDLLVAVGVGDRNVINKAIANGATAAECSDVLHSAINANAEPAVIHGRLMQIGSNPKLVSAPWPAAVAAAQKLRAADERHYAAKQTRREAIEKAGHTANSESIANVLCDDMEGVQAAAELERLEVKFGSQWDVMTPNKQAEFAESVLDSFSFGRWIKDRSRCRFDLLTELERNQQSTPRIPTELQQQ